MKNTKVLYGIIVVLAMALITSIVINLNQTTTLKNGEELVVKANKTKITAENLYEDLKDKYAMNILIEQIDHILLDDKYKTDEEETKSIEEQISTIKANYKDNDTYLQVIKSYYGVDSEEEFKELLSLEYKRNKAAKEYIKEKNITDTEIQNYYDQNIIGDVKASHILIKSEAKDNDSDEEKVKKEEEAKKKAEEIIKKLNDGEKFADLAKKYSSDSKTKDKGGDLGYFNKDDNYSEQFVNAAAQLKKEEYTKEPIKTEYGYEIILKVDEKEKPKLEDKKEEIKNTLADKKLQEDNTLYYNSLNSFRDDNIKWQDNKVKKSYENYKEKLLANVIGNNK
ncbi:MAG: hypothetical protein HFJ38_04145 [Bacilli bacterium]|nr:hypothetical protein [Bacilli bacterium]